MISPFKRILRWRRDRRRAEVRIPPAPRPGDLLVASGEVTGPGWAYDPELGASLREVE